VTRNRGLALLVALVSAIGVLAALHAVNGTKKAAPGVVVTTVAAPRGVAGATSVVQLPFGGLVRSYRLFVPTVVPRGPRPVLVGLHSYRGSAASFEIGSDFDRTAATTGSFVAYPEGVEHSWNAGTCCGAAAANGIDDVAFIARVIADVESRHRVDRGRVAMVGGSNGGMMAYRFACERSDLVDVITVLSGAYVAPRCSITRPVSVLQIHGLADTTVPFYGVATSPLVASGFPNAWGPLRGFAQRDGCTGSTTTSWNHRVDVTFWKPASCPAGTYVYVLLSAKMAHVWSSGPVSEALYGVDPTGMTWQFTRGVWSTRGVPAA
jgi:poly(3-hydroxybutyrate) depolymerase